MTDVKLSSQTAKHYVTFSLTDVPLATKLLPENSVKKAMKLLAKPNRVEAYSKLDKRLYASSRISNAFLLAVHEAFSSHRPLAISPDHIWLLICQGFSKHVKVNAEALRHLFVEHEGKKELVVVSNFKRGSANNRWPAMVSAFAQQVQANTVGDLYDLLVPTFSTSGPLEKTAFEISLMDTVQKYFSYVISYCGIPAITLEGSPDDWHSVLERTRRLAAFDLDWWTVKLIPVLEELIRTSEGHINRDFWEDIYKHEEDSGGPFIRGWVVKFFPYYEAFIEHDQRAYERNPYLTDDPNFPPSRFGFTTNMATTGLSYVPFTWECSDGLYKMQLVSGFVGVSQDHSTKALRPEIGWAVCEDGPFLVDLDYLSRLFKELREES
jgi:hypothetical protein